MSWRQAALERLETGVFDLLVIGAGIVGARVAYDAARSGMRVALVDAGDFGGATSSASSKLVHGGFRYLPAGRLRLVRQSQAERGALLQRVAPNLVRPLRCLLPGYRGNRPGPVTIGAGLAAYRVLAGGDGGRVGIVRRERAVRLVPPLRRQGLVMVGAFEEAQVHDSRLVLATVRAAAGAGAVVLNHAAITALDRGEALLTGGLPGERPLVVRFAACVNATGPWVDSIRRLEDPACSPLARLSLGVHVALRLEEGWQPEVAVAVPVGNGRVLVAQPWFGILLVGTTDGEYTGDPAAAAPTAAACRQLLQEASTTLSGDAASKSRVLHSFAGLRALPLTAGATAGASREHMVSVGRLGMVSVAGGKLTTHRLIALDVLGRVRDPRLRALRLDDSRLPGTGRCAQRSDVVDDATWGHLERLYGEQAWEVAERCRARPDLAAPIVPGGPDILAQWEHAIESEWAVTAADVLRNRTTAGIRGGSVSRPAGVREVAAGCR